MRTFVRGAMLAGIVLALSALLAVDRFGTVGR